MAKIAIPDGLSLRPQERRVFAALQDWAALDVIQRAIDKPSGEPCYTPPAVVLSQLRRRLAQYGLAIECNCARYARAAHRKWRIAAAPVCGAGR